MDRAAHLLRAAVALLLVGCARGAPTSADRGSDPGSGPAEGLTLAVSVVVSSPVPPRGAAPNDVASGSSIVIVRADRASGRQPERARTLRALVAARSGRLQLARGYTRVSLWVSEVVEGVLDDPDYAKRPVGVNTLPVVLLDEAAHAAPDSLEGFGGIWRLTRLADGTLVAQAIDDTPFPRSRVAERRATLEGVRRGLRARSAEDRLAGLDALEDHLFYELVPDVFPLLDDRRSVAPRLVGSGHSIPAPREVHATAEARLRALMAPFADEATPRTDARAEWEAFWRELLSRPPTSPAPIVPGLGREVLRVTTNQTWPELVAAGEGRLAVGVARLEVPIDGFQSSVTLFETATGGRRSAFGVPGAGEEPDGLEAAAGPAGVGTLFASVDDTWRLAIVPRATEGTKSGGGALPRADVLLRKASHAALAASDRGFGVLYAVPGAQHLHAMGLDPTGRPRGAARVVPLPAPPATDVHRGIHPLALVAQPGRGWLAAVETDSAVALVTFDDSLRPLRSSSLVATAGLAQPVLAASRDRIFLAWTLEASSGLGPKLATVVLDPVGDLIDGPQMTGADVDRTSRPVSLPDGSFALAWIEAGQAIHLGRWDASGQRVATVLVHRGEVSPFTLALVQEGSSGLVVAYQDTARYPFALRTRRIEVATLR